MVFVLVLTRTELRQGSCPDLPELERGVRYTISHRTFQELYEAAHAVLSGTESAAVLRDPLAAWDELIDFRETPLGQAVIESARDLHTDSSCDVEIDDGTVVYHNGDGGHWVMAWAFVPDDVADESDEDDEDLTDSPVMVSRPAGS